MANLHATCVRIYGRGVLLLGASGSGKSDLALRLLDEAHHTPEMHPPGAVLVADDRVIVEAAGGMLMARAPHALRGRLEIRGVGIVAVPFVEETQVHLAVGLGTDTDRERIPDFARQTVEVEGVVIPHLVVEAFQASAPAQIRAMLRALASDAFANQIETFTNE